MKRISSEEKGKIIFIGGFISLIITLLLWALFARIIDDLFLNLLEGNEILALIYFGLEIITIISSIIVGIYFTENTSKITVYKASFIAFFFTFIIILFLSYISLFLKYPGIFTELEGINIVFAFPSVMFNFSFYILRHVFGIFLLTIVIYFTLYITFLEKYYIYESNNKEFREIEDYINKIRR